jgi:diapolycopene oxygenase
MTQAIVIGSGIGGLAAAIRLARLGIGVDVFEVSEKAGGKVSERNFNGFRFDAGPSLLTLPELVMELLDADLQFPVQKLDVITKYFYSDGTRLSAYNDVKTLSEEIEIKLNVPAKQVTSYLEKASKVFDLTADLFIFGSFHRLKNLMNLKSLKTLLNFRQLQAFSSLHDFNTRELGEKKLVQLFDRYATYNGSDPYQTPATLSVISHLEHNLGAFIPEGGMFQVTDSLVKQALRLDVKFHFNQAVRNVETGNGKVSGIWTDSGFVTADMVVSDVDIHHFYSTLLPDSKRLAKITREDSS